MGDKIDTEKLMSYSDDLVKLLKNEKDINCLNHCFQQSDQLRSDTRSRHAGLLTSLQGYHKTIETCKQKTEEAAKAEVASDADIDLLQRELEDENQREALLQEDLRVITSQIKDLEEQTSFIQDRKQLLDKLQRDQIKTQMTLSLYVAVTNIIPDLNHDSKISGHIVDKEKKAVEKFEFNSQETDTCNAVWKMITH